jgi:hypothetical protein
MLSFDEARLLLTDRWSDAVVEDGCVFVVAAEAAGPMSVRVSYSEPRAEIGFFVDILPATVPLELVSRASAALGRGTLVVAGGRLALCDRAPLASFAGSDLLRRVRELSASASALRLRWTMPRAA